MTYDLAGVMGVYLGSSGDATKALYDALEKLGPIGFVATNLFRAQKASERAKTYRRHRSDAYERKQWAMNNLCKALLEHADALDLTWGWGIDRTQEFHQYVLYVDIPTGQMSFHTAARGDGPDYSGQWDGMRGQCAGRICAWVVRIFKSEEVTNEAG